jgi:glycosyltransferase involved in cell wall biosynthesis
MLIARLEPENNIETVLDGVVKSNLSRPFLVIGNYDTKYGSYLKARYSNYININFLGGIYDIEILNNLRYYSNIYFHGHTVGGTNPSLLEAMASNSLICAHSNDFNRYILGEDALYFTNHNDVAKHLTDTKYSDYKIQSMLVENTKKIVELYDWEIIIAQYADHFNSILK